MSKGEAWLQRHRKFLVFDRLLARLIVVAPERWLLKGAVALDFRMGERARATIDLDVARQEDEQAASDDLQRARVTDLGDYFEFQIERTSKRDNLVDGTAVRYHVTAMLDGRRFERIVLVVGFNQPILSELELLTGPDFLSFAGIAPVTIPAISLDQHVAEKLLAYTRIYQDGRSSTRVKDLVDIILIAETSGFDAASLRQAIEGTYGIRGVQRAPRALSLPPSHWVTPCRVLASETGLDPNLHSGHVTAASFLDPILGGIVQVNARWQPGAVASSPPP